MHELRSTQKGWMILQTRGLRMLHVCPHVGHYRDETRLLGQVERLQNFSSVYLRLHTRGIEPVVDCAYFLRRHALSDELLAHFFTVRNHGVSGATAPVPTLLEPPA